MAYIKSPELQKFEEAVHMEHYATRRYDAYPAYHPELQMTEEERKSFQERWSVKMHFESAIRSYFSDACDHVRYPMLLYVVPHYLGEDYHMGSNLFMRGLVAALRLEPAIEGQDFLQLDVQELINAVLYPRSFPGMQYATKLLARRQVQGYPVLDFTLREVFWLQQFSQYMECQTPEFKEQSEEVFKNAGPTREIDFHRKLRNEQEGNDDHVADRLLNSAMVHQYSVLEKILKNF